MAHYEEEQWVDYVRGVIDAADRSEIDEHLDSGCSQCTEASRAFEGLVGFAAREVESKPPAHLLRSIRAYYSLQQVDREPTLAERLKLTLAFDSFAEPARAGTRSIDSACRQMVYYGNDYALTLRMDYESEVSLGGELVHRKSGPVSNVPALLMSGHSVLGYSTSGELGDFRLSCDQDQPMRLRMLVNEAELIEIDLDWSEDAG